MSDLATVSAEIAPYLVVAANSLGTTVLTTAQQRLADHTVTAGEGFFRRLLRRGAPGGEEAPLGGGTEPLLDADRADALDALLARLDDRERQLLAAAVADWLAGPPAHRDASHLVGHLTRRAATGEVRIVHNSPTATGQGSIAAGEIHGDIHMGGAADASGTAHEAPPGRR